MIYGSWDIKCKGQIFVILGHFCPFTLLTAQKNFEDIKKHAWRYYHFTFVYHKWYHMMHGSWDINHNRQNFLSFQDIFYPFILTTWIFYPNNLENQNVEKIKKLLEVLSFLNMSKNHIWCMIPEIWSTTNKIFLILDHFLPFYTPLSLYSSFLKISPTQNEVPPPHKLQDHAYK